MRYIVGAIAPDAQTTLRQLGIEAGDVLEAPHGLPEWDELENAPAHPVHLSRTLHANIGAFVCSISAVQLKAVSEPIPAYSDDAAINKLIASVGCSRPKGVDRAA